MGNKDNGSKKFNIIVYVIVAILFIVGGTQYIAFSLANTVKQELTKFEAQKAGGIENYNMLQKMYKSDKFKQQQKQSLQQALSQYGVSANENNSQENSVNGEYKGTGSEASGSFGNYSDYKEDLKDIDLNSINSTAQTLSAVFPLEKVKNTQDAMEMLLPKGTPEYGEDMGVSFDEPIKSLEFLDKNFSSYKSKVESNSPKAFKRYLNLVRKPLGISCEFCCGLDAMAADEKGDSMCGCQHNPALLYTTLWLIENTDYTDGEVLKEVMKWKTLFFPQDMVGLATKVANGNIDINSLPKMEGDC